MAIAGWRGAATAPRRPPRQKREPDLDALREMVHEIKTPLNAIIGFAEIIDGQYLGPAHRRYRERAASIVGQARQLLEAVEDLDFAAKLRAGRHRRREQTGDAMGARLSDVLAAIAPEIDACLAVNGGMLELDIDARPRSLGLVARRRDAIAAAVAAVAVQGRRARRGVAHRGQPARDDVPDEHRPAALACRL